ncbi:FtsX-like permease family protein [Sphingomonas sp. 67-36]|nr:FtsX-like permease family protein [Sphingomonas sp. 67-36]MBN8847167.1 hypothetical protein [Sphingomonas sp.]
MLTVAVAIGFGFTDVMLYIFAAEHLHQYAVLRALGAPPTTLWRMIIAQAGVVGLLGTGIGLGLCTVASVAVGLAELPFRLMWWVPLGCALLNLLACLGAVFLRVRTH